MMRLITRVKDTQEICSISESKPVVPMKFEYNLSVGECVLSFFLMMAVIILGIFTGQYWLAAFGLPLFLRGLLGWCPLKSFLQNQRTAK